MVGHAAASRLPGGFIGVDVFFVISGFLITGLLVGELERTGKISFLSFYARRAKRLLPAVAVVLATTLVLTYFFLPTTRWRNAGLDVIFSGVYAMNWRLSAQAVDYLAQDDAPSILQHFWSLAVEEQFYLLWPFLLVAVAGVAALLARLRPGDPGTRKFYLLGLSLIGVPSLIWSIYLTHLDAAAAYFVTTTRLWELALGAAIAILARRLARMPRTLGAAIGWAGLAMIGIAAFVITPTTAFPGYAALLPTIGTAAVIAGGLVAGRIGPERVLGLRPVRAIGALSYSLYLWHWPLLIAAEAHWGHLNSIRGLAVVAASFIPAVLTYRFVENPIRRSPTLAKHPGRALQIGLACTVVPVVAALTFQATVLPPQVPAGYIGQGASALAAVPQSDQVGAPVDEVDVVTPDPATARDDLPDVYDDFGRCIPSGQAADVRTCVYGDPKGSFTVGLVGDSHIIQWLPALDGIAKAKKWKIVTYFKSTCPVMSGVVLYKGAPFDACTQWNTAALARLTGPDRPDLALISFSRYTVMQNGHSLGGEANAKAWQEAMHQMWSQIAAKVPVIVIRDTPRPNFDVPECVAKYRTQLSHCAFSRDAANAGSLPQELAAMSTDGVQLINLNDAICPTDPCAAVIGNVLVYRDNNHLTASYVMSLLPRLEAALDSVLRAAPNLAGAAPPPSSSLRA
jgi:peptidoglycan/LPS O-acetylase OafA/YrhL